MLRVYMTMLLAFVLGVYMHHLCVKAELLTIDEFATGLWISIAYAMLIGLMVKEERR
ncbi:MAG: hypothetical protein Aurels2KO_39430 [Aureliella sp.]